MRINNDKILHLVSAVGDLDSRTVREDVAALLAQGLKPRVIRESLDVGMRLVGEYFRSGEYFLADLLYAGRMYQETIRLDGMRIDAMRESPGTAIIGTAPGSSHDVLGDIVSCILKSAGLPVVDLQACSTPDEFVAAAVSHEPGLVVISCGQSSSMEPLGRIAKALRERLGAGLRIFVCGQCMPAQRSRELGADGCLEDAMDSLELCLSLM